MNLQAVELRARDIIDRVRQGQSVEDGLVELKTDWPAPDQRTARWIAACANAARGEEFIWLIGVDEKGAKVPGANNTDPANWLPSVRKHFHEVWPELLRHFTIPYDDKSVVVLVFESERAPYIVRKGECLEVPWRDATNTKSATRGQLLSLLVPISTLPVAEFLNVDVGVDTDERGVHLKVLAEVYVVPRGAAVTFPNHRCAAAVFPRNSTVDPSPLESIYLRAFDKNAAGVRSSMRDVTLAGPGAMHFLEECTGRSPPLVEVLRPRSTCAST